MGETQVRNLLKVLTSSKVRMSVLFSLMEGSKSLNDLKSDDDEESVRNLLRILRQLIDLDLVSKTGREYSLTNSGRLIVLNFESFMDKS